MKTVIVTGGATGIGRAIVENLIEANNVILVYNTSEEAALEIKNKYKNIDIFKCDLKNRNEIKELVDYSIEKYKKIDVLVNNAGIDLVKVFNDITDDEFYNVINTNLYSVFALTQEVSKYMIHEKQGLIINISSIWGQIGASCESIYSVSKAGIDAMTKSLAKEFGPSNIRVNSIAPGIIDTKMNDNLTESEKQDIKDEIPLQRIGKTKDIANCVNWLINDNYTTGQVININGGWI